MAAHLIRKMPAPVQRWLFKQIRFWPPYWGAGIRIDDVAADFRYIRSSMKLRWFNRNYVGTHFGGSIYSMTDPFYMLMYMQNLGPDFIVWDLAASVRFKKPGRGRIKAEFTLTAAEIEAARAQALAHEKIVLRKKVLVIDEEGGTVAIVRKAIYIRKKRPALSSAPLKDQKN